VRGASALGELMRRYPTADVQVIVVWERVLGSDKSPKRGVRAPLAADPRVVEFWDPGLWMSKRVMERALLTARAAGHKVVPAEDEIAWDFVAIFPPGVGWEDPFPVASWEDGPVLDVLGPVEEALRQ
jgi:hypothetical protein